MGGGGGGGAGSLGRMGRAFVSIKGGFHHGVNVS